MEWAPTQGPQERKKNWKKEQSQANTAGSKIYAEEKITGHSIAEIMCLLLISAIKEEKKNSCI